MHQYFFLQPFLSGLGSHRPASPEARKPQEAPCGPPGSFSKSPSLHPVEGKNIGAPEPPSGGAFFFVFVCVLFFVSLIFFTVFILFLGFGVLFCFFGVFWCFLELFMLCLDSSCFSASIASIFVEKY